MKVKKKRAIPVKGTRRNTYRGAGPGDSLRFGEIWGVGYQQAKFTGAFSKKVLYH
jgi:hypothetical protein